ncbi:MAG: hypothetical protein QXT92_00025 [Nitrososphaerota archaeon]
MKAKKIYLVSYAGYNHPEWNEFLLEKQLQQFLEEIDKNQWIRPDIWAVDVETMEVLLDFLGKLSICNCPAEDIKQKLNEILEKLETRDC